MAERIKHRAGRNRTLTIAPDEIGVLEGRIQSADEVRARTDLSDMLVNADLMEVVDAIAATKTGMQDRPVAEQKIASITVDTHGETYPEPKKLPDPYGRF